MEITVNKSSVNNTVCTIFYKTRSEIWVKKNPDLVSRREIERCSGWSRASGRRRRTARRCCGPTRAETRWKSSTWRWRRDLASRTSPLIDTTNCSRLSRRLKNLYRRACCQGRRWRSSLRRRRGLATRHKNSILGTLAYQFRPKKLNPKQEIHVQSPNSCYNHQ